MDSLQETALFIGGVGRSGTTLFADMLGLHTSLSPVYETDFVIPFLDWLRTRDLKKLEAALNFSIKWAEPLPHRPHNKREHERYHHGPHYILFSREHMGESVGAFVKDLNSSNIVPKINRLIQELFHCHAELDGKPFWINKTPAYVLYLPELKQIFPRMKFVHCIRDGRDVACSVITRPWGPNTHLESAPWWKSQILGERDFASTFPGDCLEVRYEDLVIGPAPTLKKLFAFLDVEDESESLLEGYEKERNGIALTKAPLGNWRTRFTDEEKTRFWELAGDVLSELGYTE